MRCLLVALMLAVSTAAMAQCPPYCRPSPPPPHYIPPPPPDYHPPHFRPCRQCRIHEPPYYDPRPQNDRGPYPPFCWSPHGGRQC
jgi:hypothetical protein